MITIIIVIRIIINVIIARAGLRLHHVALFFIERVMGALKGPTHAQEHHHHIGVGDGGQGGTVPHPNFFFVADVRIWAYSFFFLLVNNFCRDNL